MLNRRLTTARRPAGATCRPRRFRRNGLRLLALVASLVVTLAPKATSTASAGVGAENVIVVVNGDSRDSKTLANHYLSLRNIPPSNVVVLSDIPPGERISLQDFKTTILSPLLAELDARKLTPQVKVVAYSAGFPTGVRIDKHTAQLTDEFARKTQRPVASLNSLTFFYRFVLDDSHLYLGWMANWYARKEFKFYFENVLKGEDKDSLAAAIEHFDQEQWSEASVIYERLAATYPGFASLSLRRCQCAVGLDRMDEAKGWLNRAVTQGWRSGRFLTEDPLLSKLLEADESLRNASTRLQQVPTKYQWATGFSAVRGWTPNGEQASPKQGGIPYLLSCMLGVVGPRASTLDQAIDVLKRTAASPPQTVDESLWGFSKTGDVRTKTRFPVVVDAMLALGARNAESEIFRSAVPRTTATYAGLQLGSAKLALKNQKWKIAPGGIAENLTSYGGDFTNGSQTKLTALLHAGAAMSSGAVTEPYSIPFKFPTAMLYSHYAAGATTIEAFYSAVTCPYQLLIVGDPMVAAFAPKPTEGVRFKLDDDVTRTILCTRVPLPIAEGGFSPRQIEVFINHRLVKVTKPVAELRLNLPPGSAGFLDLKVALVSQDAIESRSEFSKRFEFGPPEQMPQLERLPTDGDSVVKLAVSCSGCDSIELKHFGRTVATVTGDSGTATLTRADLGDGPARIHPSAIFADRRIDGPHLEL